MKLDKVYWHGRAPGNDGRCGFGCKWQRGFGNDRGHRSVTNHSFDAKLEWAVACDPRGNNASGVALRCHPSIRTRSGGLRSAASIASMGTDHLPGIPRNSQWHAVNSSVCCSNVSNRFSKASMDSPSLLHHKVRSPTLDWSVVPVPCGGKAPLG